VSGFSRTVTVRLKADTTYHLGPTLRRECVTARPPANSHLRFDRALIHGLDMYATNYSWCCHAAVTRWTCNGTEAIMLNDTILPMLLGLATAAFAGACGGASSSSTASPSPTAAIVTEAFSGTVAVGGSDAHAFTVALSGGQVNATLTAASPPSTIYMGLGIGSYTAPTCTLLSNGYVITQAGTLAQLSGTVSAGSYCISVYDAGNQTADVMYAVTVNHY
jgi:hypothetical protein